MAEAQTLIADVADTAFMVAAQRAREGVRDGALFNDPLASVLAGDHGEQIVQRLGHQAVLGGWAVAIRTVVIDELIRRAIDGGVKLVLNLGAGLDTRPYRLDLPTHLQWIEVDVPRVVALKDQRLATERPRCQLERVALDLCDRPARNWLFGDIDSRADNVLVLTEGVVPYLTNDDVGSLADDLAARPHFRSWIIDYFSAEVLRFRRKQTVRRGMQNAPFKFEPGAASGAWFGFFARHGWPLKEVRYLPAEGRRLGRPAPLPLPLSAVSTLRRLFASSIRRAELGQSVGYALLERK